MAEGGGWQARCWTAARWLAVVLGFTLPLFTAADNILGGAMLLAWLAGGGPRRFAAVALRHPVSRATLALFALLALGLAWGDGPLADGLNMLRKYSNLVVLPVFLTLFDRAEDRRRALWAFALSMGLTLLLSLGLALGVVPPWERFTAVPGNPTVFKRHITQNILMAFAALACLVLAGRVRRPAARAGLLLAALLAVLDVLLVKGRTGYLVLAAFAGLALWERMRLRGLLVAAVLVCAVLGAAYLFSPAFHERTAEAVTLASLWKPSVASQDAVGLRLEFYHNTLGLIRDHPVIGVGTSGFIHDYEQRVRGSAMTATHNPHNQYLLVTAQVGPAGLLLLLWALLAPLLAARRLADPGERLLARAVCLGFVVGCGLNSLLIDHTESLLFAWMAGLACAAWRPEPA